MWAAEWKTFSKLKGFQEQIVFICHRFQAAVWIVLRGKSESAGWDSVTVNSAGRLLSFSISLGIPILSQRTRKFSLHEFKYESQLDITLCQASGGNTEN